MKYGIIQGSVKDILPKLPEHTFDAVLCDPPYELGFMGKKWDASGVAFDPIVWAACLRALRPGAPLLAFGGTRTYHRMTCAIEDAGFEIRDCLSWLYASGFPKSFNISKAIDAAAGATRPVVGADPFASRRPNPGAGTTIHMPATAPATAGARVWDGYGTALKPAWEPCVLARRPLDGTVVENVTTHGVGGLAIDACRLDGAVPINRLEKWSGFGQEKQPAYTQEMNTKGRWPANVLLDEEAAAMVDEQSGLLKSGIAVQRTVYLLHHSSGYVGTARPDSGYSDSGGASRFFYCAKVSTKERNAGLDDMPEISAGDMTDREEDTDGLNSPRAGAGRTGGSKNPHPTLKPIKLTEYLAKLALPPALGRPRRILVPFSGAGSELIGAALAGWDEALGIELDPTYIEIAHKRIAHWSPR